VGRQAGPQPLVPAVEHLESLLEKLDDVGVARPDLVGDVEDLYLDVPLIRGTGAHARAGALDEVTRSHGTQELPARLPVAGDHHLRQLRVHCTLHAFGVTRVRPFDVVQRRLLNARPVLVRGRRNTWAILCPQHVHDAPLAVDLGELQEVIPDGAHGPGGSEILGEPVVVPASTWLPSTAGEPDIALSGQSFNGGQTLGGIAFKVTDLKDQDGNSLTNESVILGLLYTNGGMDPSAFYATKGVPEGPESAHNPSPMDTALMVPSDVVVSWSPGADATQHTVYLSANQDDIANEVGGVAVAETSYDPGGLQRGATYYWRVDASDGATTVKGDIWSFTTVPAGQGGLNGEYIQGADNLTGDPTITRTDPAVDFDWSADSPGPGVDREAFTGRWRGELTIPVADTYTLIANSNDGVRVFLNGSEIIEDWGTHAARDASANLELDDGTYSIRVEYFQDGGDAELHLLWQSSRIERQVIPSVMLSADLRAEVISPANGAEEVSQSPRLIWLATSSNVRHDVYVGTDAAAVEAADPSTADIYQGQQETASYLVEGLDPDVAYYWRIDEVAGADISKGNVWSFTTSKAVVIDDFENYSDETLEQIANGYNTMQRWLFRPDYGATERAVVGDIEGRLLISQAISNIALEGIMTPETAAEWLQEQVEALLAERQE